MKMTARAIFRENASHEDRSGGTDPRIWSNRPTLIGLTTRCSQAKLWNITKPGERGTVSFFSQKLPNGKYLPIPIRATKAACFT
jgi:hypothetical protein